jgi:GTP cyclohydrolase II
MLKLILELQIFAIEECVRCAQRGGVGVVVYFRKEGRALGEVTKYDFTISSVSQHFLIILQVLGI